MINVKWIVVVAVAALLGLALLAPLTVADDDGDEEFEGNLTAPAGGNPFGGDVVGSFEIEWDGNELEIEAELDISPMSDYVFEGWLVDPGTDYKLSLGQLEDGELEFEQDMVNPFTYTVLVITMEEANDLDPRPDTPVAGALLPSPPFGQ